jgi:hypothetical protein
MSEYYSSIRDSYFEEPKTTSTSDKAVGPKQVVDKFNAKMMDSQYSVKRPIARILGNVKKQD